jgi:hypothetical protein
LLFKSLEFHNVVGQKIKVIDIPVLETNNCYYFMIQVRLQTFLSFLYNEPQEKSCHSFREYLKRKMSGPNFKELYSMPMIRSKT